MPHPDHEQNRRSWNAATPAHRSHLPDLVDFFRRGGCQLYPEERAMLGDLSGRDVLHAQCNDGRDTLSMLTLWPGARVTGVDISDVAIELASSLAAGAGLDARFQRADLLDWLEDGPPDRFDVAFSCYGCIGWLSDLDRWARGMRRVLRPGGRLVLVEFHPAGLMFNDDLHLAFDGLGGRREVFSSGVHDYVAENFGALPPHWPAGRQGFVNPHASIEYLWGLGDIVGAVLRAGLQLRSLDEWAHSNAWKPVQPMVGEDVVLHGRAGGPTWPGRRFRMPPDRPQVPLMFGLSARKG